MKRLYALAIILAVSMAAFAQTNVKIAQDKIKKDGVVLYVHNVQQSETLYSISKAYNVSVRDIIKSNPPMTASSSLKIGMILYIPDKLSDNSLSDSVPQQKGKDKQQTRKKRRLSKQERIANALRGDNSKTELTEDTVSNYADKPELAAGKATIDETESTCSGNVAETTVEKQFPLNSLWHTTKISLILPFNSKDTANLNSNFMDFYAGSLIALDTLSAIGVDVVFDVIDQRDYGTVDEIGRSGRLNASDIVIGPVKKAELQAIRPYIGENTLLVSPMDQHASALALDDNRFVQMPTDLNCQMESLMECIGRKCNGAYSNVVVIYESGNADSLYVNSITKGLRERYISYNSLHYNILEGRAIEGRIRSLLKEYVTNIVIVPSNNEAFVSDAVRNLSLLNAQDRPILLFGMPKWKNFEVIDIYQLHQLNLHLSLPYYADYDNPVTKAFVDRYKALFNTYPTPYAFQGYDIVFYIAYARYKGAYNALQSNFVLKNRCTENGYSGYFNTGTKNIIYNKDFTISVEN